MRADTVSSCDTRGQPRRVRCPTLSTPAAPLRCHSAAGRDPGDRQGLAPTARSGGGTTSPAEYKGRTVLVYFHEGPGCQPCWDQIREGGGHCALPGQSVEIDFPATDPGHWMVHCRNAYRAEGGMMAVLSYVE